MDGHRSAVAVVVTAAIAICGIVGALVAFEALHAPLFDLDRERTVPTALSGLLLAAAAWAAFVAARDAGSPWIYAVAAVLVLMSLDEVLAFHERVEQWTGIGWQFLYLPVGLLAAVGWFAAIRLARRTGGGAALLVLAGTAWAFAQILELYEWRAGTKTLTQAEYESRLASTEYRLAMVPEEVLEMAGSALFLFGFLAAVAAARDSSSRPLATRRLRPSTRGTKARPSMW